MIDIHSHILPNVDDGSRGEKTSLDMLEKMVAFGVTDVILTPHYRGRFNQTKEQLVKEFNNFCESAKNISVNLYLGQEIYANETGLKKLFDGELLSLNNTKYVLLEFSTKEESDIVEAVYMAKSKGFIPIIAHVERYPYITVENVLEIKEIGGLIQINCSSLVKRFTNKGYKLVKKLLKEDLVDFVASDIHEFRELNLLKAKNFIEKKFGNEMAEKLFYSNAKKIIEG